MRGLFPNIQDVESAMNDEEGTALAGLSRRNRGMQFGEKNVALFGPALLKREMAEHSNILVNPNDENAPYPNNGYNPQTGLEYDAADHENTGLGEYETSEQEQEQEFEYGGEAEFDPQDGQWILGDYEEQDQDQDDSSDSNDFDDETDEEQSVGRYVTPTSNMLDMNTLDNNDVYSFEDHSKEFKKQSGQSEQSALGGVATAQPYGKQNLRDGRNMGININPNIYKGADNGVYVNETRKEQIQESGVPVNQIRAQSQNQVEQFESLPQFEFGRNFMGNRFAQSMTSFIGAEDRIQANEMMPNPRGKMAQVDGVYMGSRIRADQGGGTARVVHGQRPQQQAHRINTQQQIVARPQQRALGASASAMPGARVPAQIVAPTKPIQQASSQLCVVDIVDTRGARKFLQAIQRCLNHMKRIASNKDQILKVQKEGNDLVAFLDASLKDNQWSDAISSRLKRLEHNISFLDSKNRIRLASVSINNCAIDLNQDAKQKFAPVCMTIQEDLTWFMQSIVKVCERLCDKYGAAADRMGLKKFAACPEFDGGQHALVYSLMMPMQSNVETAQVSQIAKDQCAKQDCSKCVHIARVACLQPIYDAKGMLKSEICDFFELRPIKQKVASQPIIMQDQLPDAQAVAVAAGLDLRQIQSLSNPYIMQLLKCLVQDVRQQIISMKEAAIILRKHFNEESTQNKQIPYVLNEQMKEFWGDSKLTKEEYATIKNNELKRLRSVQSVSVAPNSVQRNGGAVSISQMIPVAPTQAKNMIRR